MATVFQMLDELMTVTLQALALALALALAALALAPSAWNCHRFL